MTSLRSQTNININRQQLRRKRFVRSPLIPSISQSNVLKIVLNEVQGQGTNIRI